MFSLSQFTMYWSTRAAQAGPGAGRTVTYFSACVRGVGPTGQCVLHQQRDTGILTPLTIQTHSHTDTGIYTLHIPGLYTLALSIVSQTLLFLLIVVPDLGPLQSGQHSIKSLSVQYVLAWMLSSRVKKYKHFKHGAMIFADGVLVLLFTDR